MAFFCLFIVVFVIVYFAAQRDAKLTESIDKENLKNSKDEASN